MRRSGKLVAGAVATVAGLALLVSPELGAGPAPTGGYGDVGELVERCRLSGLSGWELVDVAQREVRGQFVARSFRQPWLSPAAAFRRRRGYAVQYNLVLRDVLRDLGFQAEAVFAARVRAEDAPWWRMAHVWVRVRHDGRTKSCCARHAVAPGDVDFVPVSDVLRFRRRTQVNVTMAMTVAVAVALWSRRLRGKGTPDWLEVPF